PKPHIRINDYYPAYLQHFGANRANRSVNFASKGHCSDNVAMGKCGSSSGTHSKTTLSVQQSTNRSTGGHASGSNLCSVHGDHHKQISSESLVQIPNKGIYKVRSEKAICRARAANSFIAHRGQRFSSSTSISSTSPLIAKYCSN